MAESTSWHTFDVLGGVAIVVLLFPMLAYWKILRASYANLHVETLRIQVLSTRTAIFLPVYSLIIWLSLVFPVLYVPLEVPTALAEGYTFFCFFSMVVTNLGGSAETVSVIEETGYRPMCPSCCCPATALGFFKRVQSALFHCLVTRTVVVLTSVVCTFISHREQVYHNPAFLASLVLTVLSLVLLVNGFVSLVVFYRLLIDESANLLGACKIILLKISVGLIVVQGLIEEFLFAFGVISVESSSGFSGEERAQRFYCFIVLVEYAMLSAAVYYAYAAEIKPSERHNSKVRLTSAVGDDPARSLSVLSSVTVSSVSDSFRSSPLSSATAATGAGAGGDPRASLTSNTAGRPGLTFRQYLGLVFSFSDVFAGMSAAEIDKPLLPTSSSD